MSDDVVYENGKTWRRVSTLGEDAERAKQLVARNEAAWRKRHRLPPVPSSRKSTDPMPCGHLPQCIAVEKVDGVEVEWCRACTWAAKEDNRG